VLASYPRYEFSGLLPLVLYPVVVITLGRLPVGYFGERLLFLLPFVLLLAIANPFLDHTPLVQIGFISISGGWLSFFSIILRFLLAVTAVLALVATTGIHDLCAVLLRAGMPRILALQLLLLYRYLSLLMEEAYRIEQAYLLRAGGRKGIAPAVWGSLAGGLLLRTYARAKLVYQAMLCRGFSGELRFSRPVRLDRVSVTYLLGWSLFILVVRNYPVTQLLGKMVRGVWQ
jgi:cobalt/nickel transport system permease protein